MQSVSEVDGLLASGGKSFPDYSANVCQIIGTEIMVEEAAEKYWSVTRLHSSDM